MKKDKGISIQIVILLIISFSALTYVISLYIFNKKYDNSSLNDINETYKQIINSYYGEVNSEELADSAIYGMMNYLNEKYSIYLDSDKTSYLNDVLDGTYKGIGITIQPDESDNIVIQSVQVNSPAASAGIKEGDILLQINDLTITKDTQTSDIRDIIENNSEINIKVNRDNKEYTYNIKVENISNPVVYSKLIDNYGYIYLESFSNDSYNQFNESLKKLEESNIKGLIIDLRNNTGGYLSECINIASIFLKNGKTICYLEGKDNKRITLSDTTDEYKTYPIVVLINGNSASASEILASSLKETYGAILVGERTYGKGKVQNTSTLSDNTMIKYTTAYWYTANNNIDGIGLIPGFTITNDTNDNQLGKSIDVLNKLTE